MKKILAYFILGFILLIPGILMGIVIAAKDGIMVGILSPLIVYVIGGSIVGLVTWCIDQIVP